MRSVDADTGPDEAYQHLKHSRLLHSGNIRPPPPPHHPPSKPSTKLESIADATLRDSSATKLEKKGRIERKRQKGRGKVCFVWLWVQGLNYNGENICNCRHQADKFPPPHFTFSVYPQTVFFLFL